MDISRPRKEEVIQQEMEAVVDQSCHQPVIITFLSEWLGASQLLESFMEDLEDEYETQRISFRAIQADHVPQFLSNYYGIINLPATLVVVNGEIVDYFKGILSKNRIRKRLDAVINS
ncbi:MAG TPA: thioredoxin domain-containing protein [Saprospiraceae bacterium]|nr:thioredoxin domain-containing protein [Saprospiraceae bacterium]